MFSYCDGATVIKNKPAWQGQNRKRHSSRSSAVLIFSPGPRQSLRATGQFLAPAIAALGPEVPVFPEVDARLSARLLHHFGELGKVLAARMSDRGTARGTAVVEIALEEVRDAVVAEGVPTGENGEGLDVLAVGRVVYGKALVAELACSPDGAFVV